MDLLGHGDNPTPWRGDLSFDRIANDVIATANHLGLHRLVLVGHSFGSGVAIACAAKTPRHVAGLLLADPIGDQRQAPSGDG
jgi:lipase